MKWIQDCYSVSDVVLGQARRKPSRSKLFRNGGYHPHKRQTLVSGRTGKAKRVTGWMDTLYMGMESHAIALSRAKPKVSQDTSEHVIRERSIREQESRRLAARRERLASLADKRWEEEEYPARIAAGVIECLFNP